MKQHIKGAIRFFIECDADIVKIGIRLSKGQLLKLLDILIPDGEE